MKKEEMEALVETGKQAACIYKGAFEVSQNSKSAEKIVFLFFSAILFGKDETGLMLLNMFSNNEGENK